MRGVRFQQYLEREGQERGVFAVVEAGGVWLFRLARPEDLLDSKEGQEKLKQMTDTNQNIHGILQQKIINADMHQLAAAKAGGIGYLVDEYATEDYVEFEEPQKDKELRLFWYPPESDSEEDLRLSFARFLVHKELWLDGDTMRGRESDGSAALGLSAEELQKYSESYRQLLKLERASSDGWLELRQALTQSSLDDVEVTSAIETFTQQALVNYWTKIEFIDKDNLSGIREIANQLADTAHVESEIKRTNGFW